jgi:serine/threonine protein kinase
MTRLPVPAYTPGLQIYKYKLGRFLGQGQFGQVWLAEDRALMRQYAVKILNPGVPVDERLQEGRIGNLLEHNNLVHVYQADVIQYATDHVVVLAMDYMPDGSITRRANPHGFLPVPDVLQAAKDILQGLDYLHANSFYHNDIKPQNILIGSAGQAMLTDYGILGVSSNGQPTLASDAYQLHMAPEVASTQNISIQTDIFQTGLTLFRLATNLTALGAKQSAMGWPGYHAAVAAGTLVKSADFPPYVPAPLRRIILKAIDPSPAGRFQSALEMRRAVEKLSFPGHWTVDAAGQLIGTSGHNQYRFERTGTGSNRSVTSFKKNLTSGHETRISNFCAKHLSASQAVALVNNLIKHVVKGA